MLIFRKSLKVQEIYKSYNHRGFNLRFIMNCRDHSPPGMFYWYKRKYDQDSPYKRSEMEGTRSLKVDNFISTCIELLGISVSYIYKDGRFI